MKKALSHCAKYSLPSFVAGWVLVALATKLGFQYNTTNSEPRGFYRVEGQATTDYRYVSWCPSGPMEPLSLRYRPVGLCADHHAPMLKRFVGAPGVAVDFNSQGFWLNGLLLPGSAPRTVDSEGESIAHFPFGHYTISRDEFWLVSSNPMAYDSRYFGPVPAKGVHYAYPVWTWGE